MKPTSCFFAAISILIYTVCAYQTGVQLVNATASTATDEGYGSITLTDKDICLLNGKGLKCEPYIKGVL